MQSRLNRTTATYSNVQGKRQGRCAGDQKTSFEPDGSYLLEIPYSDDRELLMDIMKHGDRVEVLAPANLHKKIGKVLESAANKYS